MGKTWWKFEGHGWHARRSRELPALPAWHDPLGTQTFSLCLPACPPVQVHPSFHHVYVPPWAVPMAPPQQTVRAFREAGTQTSTGAIQARPHASHTAEDVADHFQARCGAAFD